MGYAPAAPAAPEVSLAALNQLDPDLKAVSDDLATQSAGMAVWVKDRMEAYRPARAIKAAVSAQYGIRGSEYVSIKGLKF